jgi:hypothetical protein
MVAGPHFRCEYSICCMVFAMCVPATSFERNIYTHTLSQKFEQKYVRTYAASMLKDASAVACDRNNLPCKC